MENDNTSISNVNNASTSVSSYDEIIYTMNNVDVVDFCKCKVGIDELVDKIKTNTVILQIDSFRYLYNGLMDRIESNSPYLADLGRNKMNQLIA